MKGTNQSFNSNKDIANVRNEPKQKEPAKAEVKTASIVKNDSVDIDK